MIDTLQEEIYKLFNETAPCQQKNTGVYRSIKYPKFFSSFRFQTECYEMETLGNLLFLKGKGMGGKLSLLTVACSPREGIALPPVLLNVLDLGGNKMTITLEYFDVGVGMNKALKVVADEGSFIMDAEENAHWYRRKRLPGSFAKVCTKFGKDHVEELVLASLKAYLAWKSEKRVSTAKAKKDLVERMVKEGSLIPETLLKALGEEGYREFLNTFVFPA